MRKIELLAPAKNIECGIAAIDHGADAVYIGANNFGARHAAGNSIDDISQLCEYAHQFNVKVYATVNTVIYENEIVSAIETIRSLHKAGIDAILLQDMGLLDAIRKEDPELAENIVWHASTQTDNRTKEKVAWLKEMGFQRTVLARELSAEEICSIHSYEPEMELEVFVHGALCVSYSGQCYASQYCFNRSANRGECAQMCRMKYSIEDEEGNSIAPEAYYLSLKDQCQIDNLEKIIDAGACSLKIEGRLKDITYVKNVVAAYSIRLNEIIARRNNGKNNDTAKEPLCRSSWGNVEYSFTPNLNRSFNRGYTSYFLHGRERNMASLLTPKAIGENVGKVKEIRHGRQPSFNVAGIATFVNGDGLCYINRNGELKGFRVNKAEGNRLFPLSMPEDLTPGTTLYRSQDKDFDRIMQGKTATRTITVAMNMKDCGNHVVLQISGTDSPLYGEAILELHDRQTAQKPQKENILRQLSKLGGTIFSVADITVAPSLCSTFIPSSHITELRRTAIQNISQYISATLEKAKDNMPAEICKKALPESSLHRRFPYLFNATNSYAREFYNSIGISAEGFEISDEERGCSAVNFLPEAHNSSQNVHCSSQEAGSSQNRKVLLMQCRYCIRHTLGLCTKDAASSSKRRSPLYLRLADGRRFALCFDCKNCQMNVFSE